jgi:transposase
MRRTILTADQRAALQQARHDPSRPSYARDRIELLLSAADRSPPRIAAPLGCHAKTVRHLLDRFPQEGLDCLVRQPPGPPPDAARRCTVEQALATLLAEDRTWTVQRKLELLPTTTRSAGWRGCRIVSPVSLLSP